MQILWLIPLGFVVGAYGTLIGAGGGFVLVPLLLLLYPHQSPETITAISLAVVFFNAFSGSAAYARMKRIDYRSGLLFAAATIPGAVLGAFSTELFPRRLFDGVLGVVLVVIAFYLYVRPFGNGGKHREHKPGRTIGNLVEADGTTHAYSFNPITGVVLSLFVGFLSSLLGIGGGIIHVPALVQLLDFPVHIATATSHFILAIMALAGSAVHLANGDLLSVIKPTAALAVGVVIGAQLGARLSNRVRGVWILRGLAIALGLVGIRVLILAFS
ncbi:MAG: sulfite exporter TauE/SafE family protein [Candidatus Zixiibacteriota bacterium]